MEEQEHLSLWQRFLRKVRGWQDSYLQWKYRRNQRPENPMAPPPAPAPTQEPIEAPEDHSPVLGEDPDLTRASEAGGVFDEAAQEQVRDPLTSEGRGLLSTPLRILIWGGVLCVLTIALSAVYFKYKDVWHFGSKGKDVVKREEAVNTNLLNALNQKLQAERAADKQKYDAEILRLNSELKKTQDSLANTLGTVRTNWMTNTVISRITNTVASPSTMVTSAITAPVVAPTPVAVSSSSSPQAQVMSTALTAPDTARESTAALVMKGVFAQGDIVINLNNRNFERSVEERRQDKPKSASDRYEDSKNTLGFKAIPWEDVQPNALSFQRTLPARKVTGFLCKPGCLVNIDINTADRKKFEWWMDVGLGSKTEWIRVDSVPPRSQTNVRAYIIESKCDEDLKMDFTIIPQWQPLPF